MIQQDLSARRIIGFACNQAFAFGLFYMGANKALPFGFSAFERADLVVLLAFMVLGFGVIRQLAGKRRDSVFARPLLYVYAILMAAGALIPFVDALAGLPATATIALWGLLSGVPCAFLLAAWGRTFGRAPTASSIPEVFLGSLVAAFFCLAFSLIDPSSPARLAMCLLPLGSVVNIEIPRDDASDHPSEGEQQAEQSSVLSVKVLAGTFFFGLAVGLTETLGADPGLAAAPTYPVSMIVFGAFLIGALSLLLSDGFGKGAALNKSYRIAVFLMVAGILVASWPGVGDPALPGTAFVLAGYLSLEAVLVSLFLVLAKLTGEDAALAFSAGFLALFAGEACGVCASNTLAPVAFAVPSIAGIVVLGSYIFLFTERDFDELSQIVAKSDDFETTCARITETYKLSNRESEILAYALRGRTSERIAGELVISKSTVDTHLRRIYAKCGVHSRQELIDLAEGK